MSASKSRVLCMECDDVEADLIRSALEDAYSIDFAIQIADGLTLYREAKYDVVTVSCTSEADVVCDAIGRIFSDNPDQPIILITRPDHLDAVQEVLSKGILNYITIADRDAFRATLPWVIKQAVSVGADQGKKRLALAKLEQSQKRLSDSVRLTGVGYWQWDRDPRKVSYCSPEFSKIFGMTPEEYIELAGDTETYKPFIHPDDVDRYLYQSSEHVTTGKDYEIHYRVLDVDGAIHHVIEHGKNEVDPHTGLKNTFGTMQDVTESVTAKNKREEDRIALAESEARLKRAARIGKVGHWAWDEVEEKLLYCSEMNAELHGVSKNEYMERVGTYEGLFSFIHPDDHDRYAKVLKNAENRKTGYDLVSRVIWPNGKTVHVREVAEAVLDSEGNHIQTVGVTIDVTDIVNLKKDVDEREIQLHQALKLSNIGSWVWDEVEHRYEYISSEFATLFGYDLETYRVESEREGHVMFRVHPDDRDALRQQVNLHEFYQATYRIIRKDGAIRTFRQASQPVVDDDGNLIKSIGCTQDITEFVLAQNTLHEVQENYRWAATVGKLGHFVWDQVNHVYEYCSDELAGLYGVSSAEATGADRFAVFDAVAHPDDSERYKEYIIETEKSGREIDIVFRVVLNGEVRYMHERGQRIYDSEGRFIKTRGMVRDITDEKMNEQALLSACAQAETANRSKSEFLAHMSHELRTPLNAITGFSQIIVQETFGAIGHEKYLEYIRDINDAGRHLLSLIDDILDLSKIEAGELGLNEDILDTPALIQECINMIDIPMVAEDGLIDFHPHEGGVSLRADERVFKQILLNLLSNAVKFTPDSGSIRLETGLSDENCFQVIISDTGVGVASQDIPRILEPFGQVRVNSQLAQEGTGLGLSLSKRLVELHGGTLTFDSVLGEGTVVTLAFPHERTISVH